MTTLLSSAPEGVVVDVEARTLGPSMAVPYGKPGQTSMGTFSYGHGSIALPSDPSRVKLLYEHDQRAEVIGHATAFDSRPGLGLFVTFQVDDSPAGTEALRSAKAKMRDGLSVGVLIDDKTAANMARQRGKPGVVAASGTLREVSLVSVPAFDDARASAASAGSLIVSAWADLSKGNAMTDKTDQAQADDGTRADETPEGVDPRAGKAQPVPKTSAKGDQGLGIPDAGTDGPAIIKGAAGMGTLAIAGEPSTYRFGGDGPSLVRDAYLAAVDGNRDSQDRMARFNAELAAGNPASVMALAAVAIRADLPDQMGLATGYRGDLLVKAIDAGRPIASRLQRVPISNAQPFNIPTEGEFTGVGDHVEGTAHVAEGTLVVGESTISPKAVSGAYRLSRELVDSSNPAIDVIATRAMLRDYRRKSEDKVIAALVAGDPALTLNINTVAELDALLEDFVDDDGVGADYVFMSKEFSATMRADVAADGRPMLTRSGAVQNGLGTVKAGHTGYDIAGTDLVRAPRIAANQAAIVRTDGVLFVESATQQFRFEQPEGPGIIKLALWGYVGAAVTRAADVQRITTAAV